MDRELIELRTRVAALERTHRVGWSFAALAMAAALMGGPFSLKAAGPTTVTAPFTVVDSNGRALLQVAGTDAGGQIRLSNSAGKAAAEIKVSKDGCCGRIELYDMLKGGAVTPKAILGVDNNDSGVLRVTGSDGGFLQAVSIGVGVQTGDGKSVAELVADPDSGDGLVTLRSHDKANQTILSFQDEAGVLQFFSKGTPKVAIGISPDNIGMMRLASASGGRSLLARGEGKILMTNSNGVEVAAMGADPNDQGYVGANNRNGAQMATLSVGTDGTGLAQVWKSNEVGVILGTKGGNNGDVCANGPKSSVCLSVLAAKTLTPY